MDSPAPPQPPVLQAAVPVAVSTSQVSATDVLRRLQQVNPATAWLRVEPAPVRGLWRALTVTGNVVYTDNTARYLFLGVVLDAHTGKSIDNLLEGAASTDSAERNEP